MPEEIMIDETLSGGAKTLFGIIAKANREKVQWPIQYLSKRMRCSDRQTSRRIKELKDRNLILAKDIPGKACEYSVNFELITKQGSDRSVTTPQSLLREPCHHIKDSVKDTNVIIKRIGNERREIPTGEPPELNQKNLDKLAKLKAGVIKSTEMAGPKSQAEIQEETGVEIRPSGRR